MESESDIGGVPRIRTRTFFRGHIARRAGQIDAALTSEARAKDLISEGRDRLYLARPKR
jgi:hypothetical protein